MNSNSIKQLALALMVLCFAPWASADTYSYDNLNRLKTVVFTSGGSEDYIYDAAGNLLSMQTTAPASSNRTLTVSLAGSGTGTVTGSGINCGATCSVSLATGSSVTLTVNPSAGSSFSGWSGYAGCASVNPCTFNMPAAALNLVATFVVGKTSQTISPISFSPSTLAVAGTTTVSATASSALPVTFSAITANICTATSGGLVTGKGVGLCTVVANQLGDVTYAPATPVTNVITISKGIQTIGTITLSTPLTVNGASTASATASSGLQVTFNTTSPPSVCTSGGGGMVIGTGVGTCAVVAYQGGDANYLPAPLGVQNFAVRNSQTIGSITFTPTTLTVSGTTIASATASSNLPVTFRIASSGICTVSGNVVHGVAAGTCVIGANQVGDAVFAPAPEVIQSFAVTAGLTVPGAPSILSIIAGPGRVTLVLAPPSNTGGGPITTYSATCSASGHPTETATSSTTTVVVPGLVPGVSYACTATASNGSQTSLASAATSAIPKPKADLTPILMLLLD